MINKIDKEAVDKDTILEREKIKQELDLGMAGYITNQETTNQEKINQERIKKLDNLKKNFESKVDLHHNKKKKQDE